MRWMSLRWNSSATDSCTNSRSIEMHSCPAFENSARSAPSTVRARLASSSTIIAFLPPSSIDDPIRLRPACSAIRRPVAVQPDRVVDRKSTRLNSSHTEIYTLSLHDALPIYDHRVLAAEFHRRPDQVAPRVLGDPPAGGGAT